MLVLSLEAHNSWDWTGCIKSIVCNFIWVSHVGGSIPAPSAMIGYFPGCTLLGNEIASRLAYGLWGSHVTAQPAAPSAAANT